MLFISISQWKKFDYFAVIADEINKRFSNFEALFLRVLYLTPLVKNQTFENHFSINRYIENVNRINCWITYQMANTVKGEL